MLFSEWKSFGKGKVCSPKTPDLFSSTLQSVAVRWQQRHKETSSYYWVPQKRANRSHKSGWTLGKRSVLYHVGIAQREYRSTYVYKVTSLDHEILYDPREVKQYLVLSRKMPQEA